MAERAAAARWPREACRAEAQARSGSEQQAARRGEAESAGIGGVRSVIELSSQP